LNELFVLLTLSSELGASTLGLLFSFFFSLFRLGHIALHLIHLFLHLCQLSIELCRIDVGFFLSGLSLGLLYGSLLGGRSRLLSLLLGLVNQLALLALLGFLLSSLLLGRFGLLGCRLWSGFGYGFTFSCSIFFLLQGFSLLGSLRLFFALQSLLSLLSLLGLGCSSSLSLSITIRSNFLINFSSLSWLRSISVFSSGCSSCGLLLLLPLLFFLQFLGFKLSAL